MTINGSGSLLMRLLEQLLSTCQPSHGKFVHQRAGSWRLAASGFFSRAALFRIYARPPESVLPQIRALKEVYVQAGFPRESVA